MGLSARAGMAAGCMAVAAALALPVLLPLAVLTAIIRGIEGSGPVAAAASSSTAPMNCRGLAVARGFQLPVHAGIDLDCPGGTPVVATTSGVVHQRSDLGGSCVIDGRVHAGGYGTLAVLEPPAGLRYLYAHLSRYATDDGAHLKAGDTIGYEGSTGCSSGPHLHFEVRLGAGPTNPCPYLPAAYPSPAWQAAGCPLYLRP